jgi:HAD superfamily hydrolase (TIGR01549 family)
MGKWKGTVEAVVENDIMQDWKQEILEVAKDYDVITFDVFDTLLIRDVLKPIDVFWLVGGNIFQYRRILAEKFAKSYSKKDEITMQDIYKFLPKKRMEEEIYVEKSVCRANPSVKDVYNELKKSGKRIYAMSDMYLSKNVVMELLEAAGYVFDDVYVSSEYGVGKKSGKLFKLFCKKENIKKENILHIGDNPRVDGEGAKIAGISYFVIPGVNDTLRYSKKNKYIFYLKNNEEQQSILRLRSFINHGLVEIEDSYEKIGYEVLGPILVSFVQWVYERKREYGFERLFFLARDMKIVYDIYQEIYGGEDCTYFYISRAAIRSVAKESSSAFCDYMKLEKCYGNIGIVDTGWKGFTQKVIERYAKKIQNQSEVGGLYIGKSTSMRYFSPFKRTEACFVSKGKKCRQAPIYCALLESFIGSNEPQVINYGKAGEPVFNQKKRRSDMFDAIQNGALLFARQWNEYGNPHINAKESFSVYYNIFDKPLVEDIELLGNCETDHFSEAKLLVFKDKHYYRKHIMEWFGDLRLSAWKGAFFKKSFSHYGLIYSLYKALDSLWIMVKDRNRLKDKSIEELMEEYY